MNQGKRYQKLKNLVVINFLLCILCLGGLSCGSNNNKQDDERGISNNNTRQAIPTDLAELAIKLQSVGLECSEKIWPKYSFKNAEIYFVYSQSKKAYLWSEYHQNVTEIDFEGLSAVMKSNLYSMNIDDGISQLSIGIDEANDLFKILNESNANSTTTKAVNNLVNTLVFHEFFHLHAQKNWKNETGSPRGTLMPMEVNPRYYRSMQYLRLREALLVESAKERKSLISKAMYWFEKWEIEYPNESSNFTDYIEGSARFAENISNSLAENGCNANPDIIHTSFMKSNNPLDLSSREFKPGLDTESYAIGNLAIKALFDFQQSFKFSKEIENGVSPIKILNRDFPGKADVSDKNLLNELTSLINKENSKFQKVARKTIKNYTELDSIIISIPNDSLRGNFAPTGMYRYMILKEELAIAPLSIEHIFKTKNETLELIASKDAVTIRSKKITTSIKNYTGDSKDKGYVSFAIKSKDVVRNGNKFEINSNLLRGNLIGSITKFNNQIEHLIVEP